MPLVTNIIDSGTFSPGSLGEKSITLTNSPAIFPCHLAYIPYAKANFLSLLWNVDNPAVIFPSILSVINIHMEYKIRVLGSPTPGEVLKISSVCPSSMLPTLKILSTSFHSNWSYPTDGQTDRQIKRHIISSTVSDNDHQNIPNTAKHNPVIITNSQTTLYTIPGVGLFLLDKEGI